MEAAVGVGFLVVVLGLALPSLWGRGSEARAQQLTELYNAVGAASQIAHASARVHSQTGDSGLVEVDGVKISTTFGYPSATADGIVAATGINPATDRVSYDAGSEQPGAQIVISVDGSRGQCLVSYRAPQKPGDEPRITMTNGGPGTDNHGC